MKKYEVKNIYDGYHHGDGESLQSYIEDGWEIVTIGEWFEPYQSPTRIRNIMLKRELVNDQRN